jgi:hypothetical protein
MVALLDGLEMIEVCFVVSRYMAGSASESSPHSPYRNGSRSNVNAACRGTTKRIKERLIEVCFVVVNAQADAQPVIRGYDGRDKPGISAGHHHKTHPTSYNVLSLNT